MIPPSHQRYLTASMVAGCVLLLQWHSVQFWMVRAELGTAGAAWSLLLEGCALWLWWRRRVGFMALGLVASCLLLAGPMVQVAYPLVVSISVTEKLEFQDSNRLELLKQQVSALEMSLQTYERNSEKRLGWAERIDATRDALQQARGRLLDASAVPVSTNLSPLKTAVIAGQAVALLLFQVVAVLGVLSLSRWSEAAIITTALPVDDVEHEAVAVALTGYAKANNLTGKPLADALGESTTTLWRVSKPGKESVSADVLRRVMAKLEAVG